MIFYVRQDRHSVRKTLVLLNYYEDIKLWPNNLLVLARLNNYFMLVCYLGA